MNVLIYSQMAARILIAGQPFAYAGYSGRGTGLNNPESEGKVGIGPIPRGLWAVGEAYHHPRLGPLAIPLTPQGEVHGRSEFFIHGDNSRGDFSASSGCIVLSRSTRQWIVDNRPAFLIVTR